MFNKKLILFVYIWLFVFQFQAKNNCLFAESTLHFDKVIDWAYQLNGYFPGLVAIKDSKFDLIVMDYSFSGGEEDEFNKNTINNLKFSGPCSRKIILAYMNIGEAEKFRFYFDDIPKEILFETPNTDSHNNTKVMFWDTKWQNIIFGNKNNNKNKSYLDRIIDAGFDGVYLDVIDAYEFWGPKEIGGNDKQRTAAKDMVDFVVEIAHYAKNIRGKKDFLVVVQNGLKIIDQSSYPFAEKPETEANNQKKRFLSAINAIAAENTLFFENSDNNSFLNKQNEIIKLLNTFRNSKKIVFAIDYVETSENVSAFYTMARSEGYIPYATVRDLNTLTINSMFEPVCNNTLMNVPVTLKNTDAIPTSSSTNTPNLIVENSTPTPRQIPPPKDGKKIMLECENNVINKPGDIEIITLKLGESISCKLIVHQSLVVNSKNSIKIATELKQGDKSSVNLNTKNGITNKKGELEITLTATDKGIDWIGWSLADKKGNFKFNKKAYGSGNAWGIFVLVK